MQPANKVALNTGILYGKMIITAGVTLYTTRLVLNALGVTDYGIYNLVSGVIVMLSFLNAAMTTSTQRYLSFHQGRKDLAMQKKVFSNSLLLHILIGLTIVVVLEVLGLFLFNGFLNIPENRLSAAKTIYHFMSATVFFSVVSVPFTASLVAHENMLWVAIVSIVENLLKLGVALLLFTFTDDRLIYYAFLTAGVSIVSFILYLVFCLKKYEESSLYILRGRDSALMKELSSFAGWNLFGALSGMGRSQGLAVVLNLFFGAVVNAAYGIANQVVNQLNMISINMLRALNPQIMKSEGANDHNRMLRLSMMASKFSFYLLALIAIPCIFEMTQVLVFWLKNVPEYTVIFCQLIMVGLLINQLTIGLQSALQATGKIKAFQMVVGSLLLLNLPIAYLLLKLGFSAYSVLVSYITIEVVACGFRVYFLKKVAGLSIREYFQKVIFRVMVPIAVSWITCFVITRSLHMDYRFIITIVVSAIIFSLAIFFTGLEPLEKAVVLKIVNKVKSVVKKIMPVFLLNFIGIAMKEVYEKGK